MASYQEGVIHLLLILFAIAVVSVTAVRRGGIRGVEPSPEILLQAGDVLVLAGTSQHFEHAESLLMFGH